MQGILKGLRDSLGRSYLPHYRIRPNEIDLMGVNNEQTIQHQPSG